MRLSRLLRGLPARWCGSGDPRLAGIAGDSRSVGEGELFVAKAPPAHARGHARDALARGAAAVAGPAGLLPAGSPLVECDPADLEPLLLSRFYRDALTGVRLVGVTGTDGKSSTVHILRAALEGAGECAGTVGTLGVHGPGLAEAHERTTPDAPALYSALDRLAAKRVRWVAAECSSHGLDQGRLAGLVPVAAALTTFTRDHLDYHRTRAAYFSAKARLFDLLPPGAVASAPHGSPWTGRLRARRPDLDWITWGPARGDLRGRLLRQDLAGLGVSVTYPDGERARLSVPLIGGFQRDNALAALGVCEGLGVPRAASRAGIEAMAPVPGRMEPVVMPDSRVSGVVDFAHTPGAVRTALRSLRRAGGARVVAVLGCGGDRDRGKRPLMAAAALEADLAFLTSDNPRSEDPHSILDDMVAGVPASEAHRSRVVPDRKEAVREAVAAARPGDVVAVLGKGHETTQTVSGTTLEMDDRLLLAAALERKCA